MILPQRHFLCANFTDVYTQVVSYLVGLLGVLISSTVRCETDTRDQRVKFASHMANE